MTRLYALLLPALLGATLPDATNALRRQHDLLPLLHDPVLAKTAQAHAEAMARTRLPHHNIPGSKFLDRIRGCGFPYASAGENVASAGPQADPDGVIFAALAKSPVHRKNMLNPAYTHIGSGKARGKDGTWYYCQLFAEKRK